MLQMTYLDGQMLQKSGGETLKVSVLKTGGKTGEMKTNRKIANYIK
jgi:hypothetical protein